MNHKTIDVIRPVRGNFQISAEFGRVNPRFWNPYHKGTDFAVPVETPVYAVMDGVVQMTGYNDRLGNRVWILSEAKGLGRFRHGYGHLMGCLVELGAVVKKGSLIGLSGATGRRLDGSRVPAHLHFQLEAWPSRELLGPNFIGEPTGLA